MNTIRRILGASLGMGLMCFGGCESDDDAAAPPPDVHPTQFAARIGGIFGPSYDVILTGGNTVVYRHNPRTFTSCPGTKNETIRVSEEGWIRFRQALDEAQVWNWKDEYVDPDICDGTSWGLVAQYGDESLGSLGRNAYPPEEQFERFLQGVRELIGGKDFR